MTFVQAQNRQWKDATNTSSSGSLTFANRNLWYRKQSKQPVIQCVFSYRNFTAYWILLRKSTGESTSFRAHSYDLKMGAPNVSVDRSLRVRPWDTGSSSSGPKI